jgi:transposase-like protein
MNCPHCARTDGQLKIGCNPSGSQRYLCKSCQRKYTPEPKPQGYADSVHRQALAWYVDGMNLRRIGRTLGIAHQTAANWVKAHAATLPDSPPLPPEPHQVDELDELFTFIGTKKKNAGT